MHPSRYAVAAVLLLLAGPAPRAQQQAPPQQQAPQPPPPQKPTFKSSTQLVEVDAVVLDKDGNFVAGVKPDQVTILENGKPQKIDQFFMVTHELGAPAGSIATASDAQVEYSAHRVFVMLFDEGHLANDSLARVKLGAEHFLREMFHEGDAGGVFLHGGMFHGRLTQDKGELLAGVHAVQPAFENRQGLLSPFREWPRIDSEVDASRIAAGAHELTQTIAKKACDDDPSECLREGGEGQVENEVEQKARLYVRQAQILTDQTIQNLNTVTRGLARIPGRKTVVLMSEGFYVEDARSTLQIAAANAARSGITIYSIDGRGLINNMAANTDALSLSPARSTTFDTGDDGPTILTQWTGGFGVHGIDEISRAFGLIVRDTSTYYVIGYQPDNAKMDGKMRKIEIKTSVPGAKVRARKSYAAVELPPQEAIWGFGK
jgi:VWFA-related protein